MTALLRQTLSINRALAYKSFQLTLAVVLLSSLVLSKSIETLSRPKRHATDQRIVELQALLALAKNLPDVSEVFGHGHVDPFAAGRRKRSVNPFGEVDQEPAVVRRNSASSSSSTGDKRLFLIDMIDAIERRRALTADTKR